MDAQGEWESACDELVAALEACERRGCGISDDAARMVDLVRADERFGPVSVRHVARVIRRETPEMVRRSRAVFLAQRAGRL